MDLTGITFSQDSTFGDHLYRRKGETAEIIFYNKSLDTQKVIVDDSGLIADFPGIAHPDLISRYSGWYEDHRVRFHSFIKELDGYYAFVWQTQPEGRYWEDSDGFGGTSDPEINLYARMDETGSFLEPFRFYSIEDEKLYGTSLEEEMVQILESKEDPLACLLGQVPRMLSQMRSYLEKPEKGTVSYLIPGTVYEASFSLKKEGGKWYVKLSLTKRFSDVSYSYFLLFAPLEELKQFLNTEEAVNKAEDILSYLFSHAKKRGGI